MEPRALFKDVPVENRIYRLGKMDPRLACYVFATLAAKAETSLLDALGQCPREQFDELQGFALKLISRVDTVGDQVLPISVIGPNGLWADKELEADPKTVMSLTTICILFNISPFLDDNKSTAQP